MLKFELITVTQEEHKKPLWCIKYCNILPPYSNYFAAVGQNLASIYRVYDNNTSSISNNNNNNNIEIVQKFMDEDLGENYFTCTWANIGDGKPLLVVAGIRGILKVINTITFEVEMILRGHGSDIDDLCVHPIDHNLVLSASKDESIRLWNIKTSCCIAIFAGEGGHRDDVLSIDIHLLGNCFVSGGMDTSVKIWNLISPELRVAINQSYSFDHTTCLVPFRTIYQQFPLFSTTLLHKDYVDTVTWIGNLILSKSTSNRAALWAPDPDRYNISPCVLHELKLLDSEIWYIRFGVSIPLDLIAAGNSVGKVCIYSLSLDKDDIQVETVHRTISSTSSSLSSSSTTTTTSTLNNDNTVSNHLNSITIAPSSSITTNTSTTITTTPTIQTNSSTDDKSSFKVERFECGEENRPIVILSHEDESSIVRYLAFSPGGDYLTYCCDSGKLYIWSITQKS